MIQLQNHCLSASGIDFALNARNGILLAPIVEVVADANVVDQVELLQILVRLKVDSNLLELVVVHRYNLQDVIILEKISFENFNAIVGCFESLEHQCIVEQISWKSFELIIVDEEIYKIRKFIKSIFWNRFDEVAVEIQSLQLWHSGKVFTLNELHFAAGNYVLKKIREEDLSVKVRQVCHLAVFNPNIFDFEIRAAFLMKPVNVSDSYVGCVNNKFIHFTSVQSSENKK